MFNVMKQFITKLFSLHPVWRVWLVVLMVVNLVFPLFYYDRIEAQVTIIVFMMAALTGMVLFRIQGFTRLMGLMHFPWLFLLCYLWSRLDVIHADSSFGLWIRAVILLNGISLIIDMVDVIRYIAGDRSPA